MLPLRGKGLILGDHRPAIRQQADVASARIDHRLNGEGHAGHQLQAGAGFAVVQYLGVFVVDAADAMPTVLSDHGKVIRLRVGLDGMPDVAQARPGFDLLNALPHGLIAGRRQAAGEYGGIAHQVHSAGVAVESVADHRDVDIDDISAFEAFVPGNAVAHHMIDGSADGLRKTAVIEVGWDGFQLFNDKVVAALIELIRRDPRLNIGFDHVQDAGGKPARGTHFVLFCGGFYGHIHRNAGLCFHRVFMV